MHLATGVAAQVVVLVVAAVTVAQVAAVHKLRHNFRDGHGP